MSRRAPLIVVLVALAAVVAWALVPKGRAPPGSPADLEPYSFANRLPEVHPPVEALRPELLADRVARTAARIEWGPPDVFYWSARHLPEDRDALARALLARLERVLIGSPLLAQRLVDALALLAEPVALRTLLRIAASPPAGAEFLQVAAVRALAKYPRDEQIDALFGRLSVHPHATIRHAVMSEVVKSEVLGDAAAVRGFLEAVEGAEAVPFLQEAAMRRLADCVEACALHLDSPLPRVRQSAILALLALADPRGRAAAEEELAHSDPDRVALALSLYRDAGAWPPLAQSRVLAAAKHGPIRREVALALAPAGAPADPEPGLQLLRLLASDPDLVVRQAAVEQLWRHGRQEGVESWRERLRHGHGAALREAAQFLCETLRDPLAAQIVRERLASERLEGPDQANLLGGLRHVGGAQDIPRYVELILRAGTAADVRGSERTFLSEHAAQHVQTFRGEAAAPLALALERAPTPRAKLALLDALRGVASDADAAARGIAVEAVLARLLDPAEERGVRMAAVDTIAWFDDASLGERLYALRERVGDKPLADRIVTLYASFF